MLIKPETCKFWEESLSHYKNIDGLIKIGNPQKASEEATYSFLLGYRAVYNLSKELKMPDLTIIATNALHGWFERTLPSEGGKHYTPAENIEWICKTLRRLSEGLPVDTLPSFRF